MSDVFFVTFHFAKCHSQKYFYGSSANYKSFHNILDVIYKNFCFCVLLKWQIKKAYTERPRRCFVGTHGGPEVWNLPVSFVGGCHVFGIYVQL